MVKPINCIYKRQGSIIGISSYNLSIEGGHHRNILRNNRIFKFCTPEIEEIEEKYHFVLIYPRYQQLQVRCIEKYYWETPLNVSIYTAIICKQCYL